jgi:hypothetical protein
VIAADVRQLPWAGPSRSPLHLLAAAVVTPAIAVADWLGRAGCGLCGHVMVRHFEPRRMSLACLRCGEETPGWTFDGRPS